MESLTEILFIQSCKGKFIGNRFYFPLFQNHFHTLPYKQRKAVDFNGGKNKQQISKITMLTQKYKQAIQENKLSKTDMTQTLKI